jgi:hypothetical protein
MRRCQSKWWRVECGLVDNGGVFIAKGWVVVCNPHETVLDDWFGEDHVGLSILYCHTIVLAMTTIWKWLLVQTILDGYPLKKHLITFNATHILDVDDVKVNKKIWSFHKMIWSIIDSKGFVYRIEKMLLEESMCNMGAITCCTMNCCQHFPHEKTLLRQKFWSLSFKDRITYGLDILKRLHMRGNRRWQKFITIQGLEPYHWSLKVDIHVVQIG